MLERVKGYIEKEEWMLALQAIEPFMEKEPMNPMGLFLLGQIMLGTQKQTIAYPIYKLGLQIEPKRPEMWLNMGKAAGELHFYEEEEACFKKALKFATEQGNDESAFIATQNLSTCAVHQTNPDKAIFWGKKALKIGESRQSRIDLGFSYLMKFDYGNGWKNYNEGMGNQEHRDIHQYIDEPEWDGSSGKRLIVYGEQGLGDQIAFAEAVRDVRRISKSVTLHVNPKLVGLLSRSFILPVHGYGSDDDKAWVIPIDASASMSRIQQYVRDDISKYTGKPFLKADDQRRLQWKALFKSFGDKLKVGIAWTGGSQPTQQEARSTTLEDLLPLLKTDVDWISLEYQDRTKEVDEFTKKHGIKIHDFSWATRTKDYDDTAGLVAELDLVITIPTSIVHLAGGLGVPCLVMVHPYPHFMFGLEKDSMPLYESVKLFRRKKDWGSVIKGIKGELDEMRDNHTSRTGTSGQLPKSSRIGKDGRTGQGTVLHDRCISC